MAYALVRAVSRLRTPEVARQFQGFEEISLTQLTRDWRAKPGGTDDRFLSSVGMGALRAPIGMKMSVVSGDEVAVTVE